MALEFDSKKQGKGHSGSFTSSRRLRATLEVLQLAGSRGLTTAEIHAATGSLKPSSDVWALRDRGIAVDCDFERTDERTGSKIYRFTLAANRRAA